MPTKLDRVLQKDILAIMLKDLNTVLQCKSVVDPKFFTTGPYRFLCKKIYEDINSKDGELPSEKTIKIHINKNVTDEEKRNFFKKKLLPLFKREVEAKKGLTSEIKEWAEKQKFALLLEEASKRGSEGDIRGGQELIKSSFLFDTDDKSFQTYDVFNEWKRRQRERKLRARNNDIVQIKTGIRFLDDYLFIRKGQSVLALIMGTSGVGKSISAINIGVGAIRSRCRVAHFVFENTSEQTLARYDSRILKYPYNFLTNFVWSKRLLQEANKTMRRLRRLRGDLLKVIHAPIDSVSVSDCEGFLRQEKIKTGWEPDLIVYDSLDHLNPTERQESHRLSVSKVFKEAKRQSEIRNIPIWSTTHAKAEAKGTTVRQESFSESYDKVRLADVVTTWSQTAEQEDDKQAELRLDKWRDGEAGMALLADLVFGMMMIRPIRLLTYERQEEEGETSDE